MMRITPAEIQEYMEMLVPVESPVLAAMEEEARENGFPIVGRLVGRFLYQVVRMLDATRILEMGSGFGYSAYWFASAFERNGTVMCTDGDPANKKKAEGFLKDAELLDRVEFRVGNALELVKQMDGPFDIIFNDIDKHQYPDAFRLAIPRLRPGGVLITDNALWNGEVLSDNPDTTTAGVLEYNRAAFNTAGIVSSILPLRDGLCVSVKL
jgi:predicted O-methyltransferase YrrM